MVPEQEQTERRDRQTERGTDIHDVIEAGEAKIRTCGEDRVHVESLFMLTEAEIIK